MYNLALDSKYKTLIIIAILFFIPGCVAKATISPKADKYIFFAEEDALSEKWAEYTFSHLSKRFEGDSIVGLKAGAASSSVPNSQLGFHIEIAEDLKNDYCFRFKGNILHIRMKTEKIAVWMAYQIISAIGEVDERCRYDDLPPATVSFTEGCYDYDFEYREPYFSLNLQPDFSPILGNNNVETDWGLWGHNIMKIIPEEELSEKEPTNYKDDIFALVNGERNENQFNFSSDKLFRIVSNFIIDNYGDGKEDSYRFMIAPQDNNLVCTCPKCSELGNTETNLTPAVADFVRKLCERFPKHRFFTIAYKTTYHAPKYNMPQNAGIFLSTIELPRGVALTENQPKTKQFLQVLEDWKRKTPNIYVWDYAANFDDYLTPIPLFYGMKKQFRFLKENGIKGIFINGSGYDYSTFDDLKTIVSSALMKNIETDIDSLCFRFLKKKYPKNHQLIYDYYIELEKDYDAKAKAYNMYGGFQDNLKTYLDEQKFIAFYETLKKNVAQTDGTEKKKVETLLFGLHFTRLQIAHAKGGKDFGFLNQENEKWEIKPEIIHLVKDFQELLPSSNLKNYKETGGDLNDYIQEWNEISQKGVAKNLLLNHTIELLSTPDEGFEKTTLLNDGVPGFAIDYHQGWYISSGDLEVRFSALELQGEKKIELQFLKNERHRFSPPEKIELWVNNQLAKVVLSTEMTNFENKSIARFTTNFPADGKVTLKMIKNASANGKIACDEIRTLH